MRSASGLLAGLLLGLLLPAVAFAQAGIAGNVRDTSGAVLPGVTVEASSPALIEKTRSVVTDGAGNYRIEDLRPGGYSVTFTLTGFNTVKREGIELTGSFVATVNAELPVGAVAETISVTAQTPIVDITSATRQRVLTEEVLNTIPTGRSYYTAANLIPGLSGNNANDPGAVGGGGMTTLAIHGGRAQDMRVLANGLNFTTSMQDGTSGGNIPNQSAIQEMAVDTDTHTADRDTSGVQVNIIFKEGGNRFSSYNFVTWGGEQTSANNLTDRLKSGPYGAPGVTNALGLQTVNHTKGTWELNPSFGGPIKRDKLWFYYAFRYQRSEIWSAGMYYNKNAFNPTKWTFDPDLNRPMLSRDAWYDSSQILLTWRATDKNKFVGAWDLQNSCECPSYQNATASPPPLVAPESAQDRRFPHEQTYRLEWTSPVSNRLMFEAREMRRTEHWGLMHLRPQDATPLWPFRGGSFDRTFDPANYAIYPTLNPVIEQNSVNGMQPGLVYRGPQNAAFNGWYNNVIPPGWYTQLAASYITGSHAFKVGFNSMVGYVYAANYQLAPGGLIKIRARSPVDANGHILAPDGLPTPNQITLFASPYISQTNLDCTCAIYAQDKWTMSRVTFNYGARFDWFHNSYDDVTLPASPLFIGMGFARGVDQQLSGYDNIFWKDISPRFGLAWDVKGDGKTAVKVNGGRYVQSLAAASFTATNPTTRLVTSASRSWTDANRDMRIDCNYLNPATNGECGPFTGSAVNFGTMTPAQLPDAAGFNKGWNIRPWNWEFSAGIQRQLMSTVSAEVTYFRRIFGNFNTALYNKAYDTTCGVPGDHSGCFTQFSLNAPTDSRLGDTSGTTIGGLYDVLPQFAALPAQNINALLKDIPGAPNQYFHWNGVDVSVNARLAHGVTLQAGTSTGSFMSDNCELSKKLPETLVVTGAYSPAAYCHYNTPWKTSFKAFGSYLVPKIDVQLAAFAESIPEVALFAGAGTGPRQANFILSAANVGATSTLGRALTAAGGQQTINLLSPGTSVYQEAINEVDLRIGKILRRGSFRVNLSVDVFNVFNADVVTQENFSYDSLFRPINVLQARFAKFTAQFEF